MEDELLATTPDTQPHFLHRCRLLIEFDSHQVGMPHIKRLDGKNYGGMRMKGRNGISRGMYITQTGRCFTVLHVFTEPLPKKPAKELVMVQARMKELTQ